MVGGTAGAPVQVLAALGSQRQHPEAGPTVQVTPPDTPSRGAGLSSLAGYGLLPSPVRITVKAGRAVDADTDVGRWLLETLDSGGDHGSSLAELGIGTNPAATLTGNVLEDEKVIGTAHIAFGTSAGLGGVNVAGVHIDGVLLRATVEVDGERLLDHGDLLVA